MIWFCVSTRCRKYRTIDWVRICRVGLSDEINIFCRIDAAFQI